MAEFYGTFLQTPIQGFKDHLTTNTVASLVLFQATWPLLQKAKEPKFVTVSSTVGSVGDMESWMMSAGAYGASKAALNVSFLDANRDVMEMRLMTCSISRRIYIWTILA